MAKRFIDTKQWADPWYQSLKPEYKLLWHYLFTNCDHAGGWKANPSLAEFQIGCKIDWVDAIACINNGKDRIVATDSFWLIIDFINFQYGNISESPHSFHLSVMDLRQSHYTLLDTLSHTLSDTLWHRLKGKRKEEEGVLKENKDKCITWKTSFEIYEKDCVESAKTLLRDIEWINEREKYHPGIDIRLSMEKAINDFWATEAGWSHKKKSKCKEIDWQATFQNALSMKSNQVRKTYDPRKS